jgi:hypothetical protein
MPSEVLFKSAVTTEPLFNPPVKPEKEGAPTIEAYFDRPDTPAANSPVGVLMVKIVAKYPIIFEDARQKAHELLDRAAKAKNYRTPQVYSEVELEARKERLKDAFNTPKTAVSGVA